MSAIVRSSLRAGAMAALVFVQGLMIPIAIAQQRVGVDSAVNPDATGIAPGASPRRLVLGQEVVLNERIATGRAVRRSSYLSMDRRWRSGPTHS